MKNVCLYESFKMILWYEEVDLLKIRDIIFKYVPYINNKKYYLCCLSLLPYVFHDNKVIDS